MSGQPVILYKWPTSQICLECEHSTSVMIGDPHIVVQDPASVICEENCNDNDGINCCMYSKMKRRNEL